MSVPTYFLFKRYSVEVKRWLQSIFHIPRLDNTNASVKVVYATPERAIAKYVVPIRNQMTDIPVVGFYLANMSYQLEKNTAIENYEVIKDKDNNIAKRMKPFQVYSLTYVINIWTKLQMDMDVMLYSLLSQLTPFRYLAVDSNIDYKEYDNLDRFYPMENGPQQGKNIDANTNEFERKHGQWFPLTLDSVNDASNLEPGEAGKRVIRTDINLLCDRAYLPIGGFEYKSIRELEINSVLDWYTEEGISIYALSDADYNYLMTHDENWHSPVPTYGDLPMTGNITGDIRRVTSENGLYDDGEPYIWGVEDISFYKPAVDSMEQLPCEYSQIAFVSDTAKYYEWRAESGSGLSEDPYVDLDWYLLDPDPTGAPDITVRTIGNLPGSIDGDIRYVNNESEYYRWNGFTSEWQLYNRWIKYRIYLRDIVT